MQQGLKETCQEGTQIYEAYLKHMTCIFELSAEDGASCYFDLIGALLNYPLTGNTEEDEMGMLKLTCRYDDQVKLCLKQKVFEVCGEEAVRFYLKFKSPSNKLITRACMESGAA